jgi:large subunit ribosomal protein L25
MSDINLKAYKRERGKKSDVKNLRKQGYIPGVFYLEGKETIPIYVTTKDLNPLVYTAETHVVKLKIDNQKPKDCILKHTQFDPLTDKVVHFDLQGLTAGHEITMEVPVVLNGDAPGVEEGGIVQQFLNRLDVSCLPKDIPDQIEVDISELNIGDSISVADIKTENIKVLNSEDSVLVSVAAPRSLAEEEEEVEGEELEEGEEMEEPEVIGKGKKEEDEEEEEE